jgi:hypothetical protein
MRELTVMCDDLNAGGLDLALRAALPGKANGVSGYGLGRPISIWLDDSASGADETTALGLVAAHDPVFLSANKRTIEADGVDAVTITVRAPKPGAAAVTLQVSVNGGAATDWGPIALTDGVGSDALTALDPGLYSITVKNAVNRSAGTVTVEAI